MGVLRSSVLNLFLCPKKFVLNTHCNKNKYPAPITVYFALQTLKPGYHTGLVYASLHFQTCGILAVLTSESTNVSDISPHIIVAVISVHIS